MVNPYNIHINLYKFHVQLHSAMNLRWTPWRLPCTEFGTINFAPIFFEHFVVSQAFKHQEESLATRRHNPQTREKGNACLPHSLFAQHWQSQHYRRLNNQMGGNRARINHRRHKIIQVIRSKQRRDNHSRPATPQGLVNGFGLGLNGVAVSQYISEIAPPNARGMVG